MVKNFATMLEETKKNKLLRDINLIFGLLLNNRLQDSWLKMEIIEHADLLFRMKSTINLMNVVCKTLSVARLRE